MNKISQLTLLQAFFLLFSNLAFATYNYNYSYNTVAEVNMDHIRFSVLVEPLVLDLGDGKSLSVEPKTYCRASRHTRRSIGGIQTCSYYIETVYIDNHEKGNPGKMIREKIIFDKLISSKIINYISNALKIPIDQINNKNALSCVQSICSMKNTYDEDTSPSCCSLITGEFRKELLKMEKKKDPNGLSKFINRLSTSNIEKVEFMKAFIYRFSEEDGEHGSLLIKIKGVSESETTYHLANYLLPYRGKHYYNFLESKIGIVQNKEYLVFKTDDMKNFAVKILDIEDERQKHGVPMYNPLDFNIQIGAFDLY